MTFENDAIDDQVAHYLSLCEQGEAPTLEHFLLNVPDEIRTECKNRIETAHRVRTVLGALGKPKSTRPASPPDLPGFRILRELGTGGLGSVFLAEDLTLERNVALKVLHQGTGESVRKRILTEARKAASLSDPNIVTIHSVVDHGENPAIVMEHIEGYPIDVATQSLNMKQRARILQNVARALATAHKNSIIHRDLKPDNILVTPDLQPKVLDFGLAASTAETAMQEIFRGTPLYASPEQARCESLSSASDIFSLGSVIFTVLTGRSPFQAESTQEVLQKIASEDPPFPLHVATGIPADLQAICLACLARDPEVRPRAQDVATDFGRYLSNEPILLRPAMFKDVLRRKITGHSDDLRDWETQGMISSQERDRLQTVYRRILADEDHWILDSRRLTISQTILYASSWSVVVAGILMVWLIRDEVSPTLRYVAPCLGTLGLVSLGLYAYARREILAAASMLAGAVLSVAPAILSALSELAIFSERPEHVVQLLGSPFSNHQIAFASVTALILSLLSLGRLRMTGFAWTTSTLLVTTYISGLLLLNWLDQDPEIQALWCLPLVLLEIPALLLEKSGRVRWAMPFHLVAFLTLVLVLDVIANQGPTLALLGVEPADPITSKNAFLTLSRLEYLSFALNGVLFVVIMVLIERARSLDLRRAARILELIAPCHLLVALYVNVHEQQGSNLQDIDTLLYLAAVAILLLLAPWRHRRRFLFAGLVGIAVGSHLIIDVELLEKAPFVMGLGISGLIASLITSLMLIQKPRQRKTA